jgi:hypothetical protein
VNATERDDRIRLILQRRVTDLRQEYGMVWHRRETVELVSRLMYILASSEGIDDVDLRAMVRLYHRETLGRRSEGG